MDGRLSILVDEDNDGTFEEATDETDTTGLSRLAFNATYNSDGTVASGTTNLTQSQAAQNASLVVDGLTVSRSTNTISDVLSGVTLTLLDDSDGNNLSLTVGLDKSEITAKVNAFVSAYNGASGLVRSLTAVGPTGGSVLTGDSTARNILDTLRNTVTTDFGSYAPANFGLSHSKEGVLSLESSYLEDLLDSDLSGVQDSLDQMAEKLEDDLSFFISTAIPARTDRLNTTIKNIDDDIAALNRRLVIREATLIDSFATVEQIVGGLQASGDFLTQQFAVLQNVNKS